MKETDQTSAPILSHVANSAIVHLPGRKFPAVAIQGDSLSIMLGQVKFFAKYFLDQKDEELYFEALDLALKLQAHLTHYEDVLEKNGMTIPYGLSVKKDRIADEWEKASD